MRFATRFLFNEKIIRIERPEWGMITVRWHFLWIIKSWNKFSANSYHRSLVIYFLYEKKILLECKFLNSCQLISRPNISRLAFAMFLLLNNLATSFKFKWWCDRIEKHMNISKLCENCSLKLQTCLTALFVQTLSQTDIHRLRKFTFWCWLEADYR